MCTRIHLMRSKGKRQQEAVVLYRNSAIKFTCVSSQSMLLELRNLKKTDFKNDIKKRAKRSVFLESKKLGKYLIKGGGQLNIFRVVVQRDAIICMLFFSSSLFERLHQPIHRDAGEGYRVLPYFDLEFRFKVPTNVNKQICHQLLIFIV